jgi:uncharacterized protein (DUF305 family)
LIGPLVRLANQGDDTMTRKTLTVLAAIALMASPAVAQHNHGAGHQAPRQGTQGQGAQGHGGHGGHAMPNTANLSPAARAFAEANAKMHKDMTITFSGNADVDFARAMIPHHQGAIDMAEIVLKFGKDAAVKKLANEIIVAQKKEIAQMRAWLDRNGSQPASADAAAITKAFTDVNTKMHKDMTMSFTNDADADFMKGMIPHHEGAVDMAKVLLQFGKDAELRKLADDVIRTQNEEIGLMKDWIKKNGQGGHRH